MAITIIAADIQHTVTLDSPPYAAEITVSRRGSIAPVGSQASGILATASDPGVINYGTISGGGSPVSSVGGGGGISLETQGGTVINFGAIFGGGNGGAGVYLGGTLSNSGLIVGGAGGRDIPGGSGVILTQGVASNTGTIIGGADRFASFGFAGDGVDLEASATFFNQGMIVGGAGSAVGGDLPISDGVLLYDATLINTGTIAGGIGDGTGVTLTNGGLLINQGDIAGAPGGDGVSMVSETFIGTLVNSGTISGGSGSSTTGAGTGVYMFGGTLINTGVITGGVDGGTGVYLAGGTVTNAGTIAGGSGDSLRFGSAAGTLVIAPGAVFDGLVDGNGTNDTLELASAASSGTLSGLGTAFAGFATVDVAAGAQWVLLGTNSIAGAATIGGTLLLAGGTLDLASGAGGDGDITLDAGATLVEQASTAVAETIFAAGGPEQLQITAASLPTSEMIGFAAGDTIDLVQSRIRSVSFADGTLTLDDLSGNSLGGLLFQGSYDTADFTLKADGHGGTDIGFRSVPAALASGLADLLAGPSAAVSIESATLAPAAVAWPDFPDHPSPAAFVLAKPVGGS